MKPNRQGVCGKRTGEIPNMGSNPITSTSFQRADSSTVERFNGIEEMAVQFRPCPQFYGPIVQWQNASFATKRPAFDSRRVHNLEPELNLSKYKYETLFDLLGSKQTEWNDLYWSTSN